MNITDFFAEFATDPVAEAKGAIVTINGVKFKIARAGNKPYHTLLNQLVEENQAILDGNDEAAEAKSDEIMAIVMSKTILLGWEGELPFQGAMLKYTQQNAKDILTMRDFRARVMRESDSRANYKAKMVKAKVKN